MIPIKSRSEIEIMKEGGEKLVWVFKRVLKEIKSGVKLEELNHLAEELIKKQGGFSSFKMVKGYHWATCINVNQGVVHGIPTGYQIKNGDVVSLDMGMYYKGFHTDMARTLLGGRHLNTSGVAGWIPSGVEGGSHDSPEVKWKFLRAGEKALKRAINAARPGNRVGHISAAIEGEIKKAGFTPIEALTGHGVGRNLHEDPRIPCFLKGEINQTPLLEQGMTLAIEVIYAQDKPDLALKEDGWTVETVDGKIAGLFEDTLAVTKGEPLRLTPLDNDYKLVVKS